MFSVTKRGKKNCIALFAVGIENLKIPKFHTYSKKY